jgi:hypothetical protein
MRGIVGLRRSLASAGQAVLDPGYRTFASGARDRADATRKALMLAADTAIPPQKSSFRGAARLGPRTSTGNVDADDQTLLASVSTQYRPAAVSRFYQTAMTKQPGVGQCGNADQPSSYIVVPERNQQLLTAVPTGDTVFASTSGFISGGNGSLT